MTTVAWIFMGISWSVVIGVCAVSMAKILRNQ